MLKLIYYNFHFHNLKINKQINNIFLPAWERGRPDAIDVTIISPRQLQTLARAATCPGYAFRVVENRKLAAHLGECRSQGIDFFPMVAESLGGWSDEAISIIQRVGHMLGQRLGVSSHISI